MTKVWAFLYNDCIHESGWSTVSLHTTKEGATNAMDLHKANKRTEWKQIWETDADREEFPFGEMQHWCVEEVEILP